MQQRRIQHLLPDCHALLDQQLCRPDNRWDHSAHATPCDCNSFRMQQCHYQQTLWTAPLPVTCQICPHDNSLPLVISECSGFVASGPLVVLAEAALRMGPRPSYIQQMLLFQLVAALTLAGSCVAACMPVVTCCHSTASSHQIASLDIVVQQCAVTHLMLCSAIHFRCSLLCIGFLAYMMH